MVLIKEVSIIFLFFIMFFCMGCNKDIKTTSNPTPYPSETAIKNGDVVRTNK